MLRYDPIRVLVVTLGLALAGAVSGGFAGVVALAMVMVLRGDVAYFSEFLALEIAGEVGAVLGLISAPLVVWVMLRRVPVGRVFLWLTSSAVLGGIFGWFAFSSLDVIFGPTIAAFTGFIASAVALSIRYAGAPALTGGYFARFETQVTRAGSRASREPSPAG
jgi:hypothetical protein